MTEKSRLSHVSPHPSNQSKKKADDVELNKVLGMKRKSSLGDDGIIRSAKKLVHGMIGVHSASDEEEDESGEEVA